MIFDTLDHIEAYKDLHPRIYRGLTLLKTTDFSALADGKVEVEGKDLYFSLQSYQSKTGEPKIEAHRDYADIQVVLEGREHMGVAPLADMTEEWEARPEKDVWFYHGPIDNLTLTPGKFVILFPQDAHAPGMAIDESQPVRKCVVKIRL